MKSAIHFIFFASIIIISTNSCSKKDDCEHPVDCLPPATQIGANTAGCLVNGKILVPSGRSFGSGSVLISQYLFYQGAYFFSIGIDDREENQLISIRIENSQLEEGGIYPLQLETENSGSAAYIIGGAGSGIGYVTTNNFKGELHVTNLDETKKIVSGTFWFDAINSEGESVQITQGRFDVRFQQ